MDESLDQLKVEFAAWRKRKRHAREAIPVDLMRRACAATRVHGAAAVYRATKVDRGRLKAGGKRRARRLCASAVGVTAYSHVELAAPGAASRLLAEVEMQSGMKVRLFAGTSEALGLLSSLFTPGGGTE